MEAALKKIDADVLLAEAETGQPVYSVKFRSTNSKDLADAARQFVALDKLSANLKMGPLNQTVIVRDDEVELSRRHAGSQIVSAVSSGSLDRAFLAESLSNDLVNLETKGEEQGP